jgi:hypothetical protein
MKGNTTGRRPVGRPRWRWLDAADSDAERKSAEMQELEKDREV